MVDGCTGAVVEQRGARAELEEVAAGLEDGLRRLPMVKSSWWRKVDDVGMLRGSSSRQLIAQGRAPLREEGGALAAAL
jgi:hypothetical protein